MTQDTAGNSVATNENTIGRRSLMKTAAAGSLGISLAGCTESLNQNDGAPQSANKGSGDKKFSGVSFTFWDGKYYRESRQADKAISNVVNQFNKDTGASCKLNKQDSEQALIEAFKSGNQPEAFTQSIYNMGKFIGAEQLQPFSNYQNQHGSYVENLVENVDEYLDFCYAGWPEDNYAVPLTSAPYAPFIARADHFEAAGLDIEKDFPPKDYNDLVRIATKLEENGPGTGFQPYGGSGDLHDVYFNQWTSAMGGKKGWGFTEDWSDVRFENDVWTTTLTEAYELYDKHGFGTPQTPTMSDEDAINLLIEGKVSLCNQASFNQPVLMERAGDLMESGDLVWGSGWGGETGNSSYNWTAGVGFATAPKGKDKATWEKKQKAAHAFVNYLSNSDFMTSVMPNLGFMPSRADTVESIKPDKLNNATQNWFDVTTSVQKHSPSAYECHPLRAEVYSDTFAVEGQKVFQGKQSVEEACTKAAEKSRELIADTQFAN